MRRLEQGFQDVIAPSPFLIKQVPKHATTNLVTNLISEVRTCVQIRLA